MSYTSTNLRASNRNLPQADPYFDSVVLLAPFSGEDGDTTSTDLSNSAHTLTFNSNSVLDGDIRKYGFTSCLMDGVSDYVSAADHADWDLGAGDWTIECWTRFNGDPGTTNMTFVAQWEDTSGKSWIFDYYNNLARMLYSANGTSGFFGLQAAWNPVGDAWYHVACVRNGSTIEIFIDGTSIGTDTAIGTTTLYNSTAPLRIGSADVPSETGANMDGWIENVRITKGVARYTAAFTPPERAFPTQRAFVDSDIWPTMDQWTLSETWDDVGGVGVSTLSPVLDEFSIRQLNGWAWSSDGTKLLVTNFSQDVAASYSCTTPYDVDNLVRTGTLDSTTNSAHARWSPDGTSYFMGVATDSFKRMNAGTTFEVNSTDTEHSRITEAEVMGEGETNDGPYCVSPNGDYIVGVNEIVNQVSLAIMPLNTPYDLDSFSAAGRIVQDIEPPISGSSDFSGAVQISSDGTQLYYLANTNTMYRATLSTPWDSTTVSFDGTTLSPGNVDFFYLNDDATELWLGERDGGGSCRIRKYTLS